MKKAISIIAILLIAVSISLIYLASDYSKLKERVHDQDDLIERLNQKLSPELMHVAFTNAIKQHELSKNIEKLNILKKKYNLAEEIKNDNDHIYGDLDAEISIIEFSDIECPYCKKFHDTPRKVVNDSSGNVNWVWKHLPLSFHNPAAKDLAILSECVAEVGGNQKFWMFTDLLFKHTKGNGQGISDTDALIDQLMLDKSSIASCLDNQKAIRKVEQDMAFASTAGVTGTPSVFIIHHQTGKVIKMPGFISEQQLRLGIKQLKAQIAQ